MSAEIEFPVYVRVGDGEEAHIGTITLPLTEPLLDQAAIRAEMATFYRGVADVLDSPPDDDGEEVDGAAA
ncbi:hypothetical protein ACIPQA_16430 [Streptomyces sp. NPDC090109]|uniref:hypothetical protein n=1 Tax=Streptomyces sp. NPDC090109 TaxID=3365948 RepID=UPI00382611D5